MKSYAIYLRKSRADMEAEARGEGETLARHRSALLALASRDGYDVAQIYQEIVSGDTIAARPQMQALLSAVQAGQYAGVICNDIDRLSRGDMQDQGLIQAVFASTGTLIITPGKIYDPANDMDSTFVDMSLFMARFEYKQIKKRMMQGRIRSAAEGNVQSGRVPFGYIKIDNGKGGKTLVPDPDKADIVRMMFRWYAGGKGRPSIASELNALGVPTRSGRPWTAESVRAILQNTAYLGQYTWRNTKQVQIYQGGVKKAKFVPNDDKICVFNAFPAIIDKETFDKAQDMRKSHALTSNTSVLPLQNSLAGILKCGVCGITMTRSRNKGYAFYQCRTPNCPNRTTVTHTVEELVLEGIRGWTVQYKQPAQPQDDGREAEMAALSAQREKLDEQMDRIYDMAEQGIYSPQMFVQRRDALQKKIDAVDASIERLRNATPERDAIVALMPKIISVLDAYWLADDAAERNTLLKSIIHHVDYRRIGNEPISLRIFPKILERMY